MSRNNIIFIALIVVLGGLSYFAYTLFKSDGDGNGKNAISLCDKPEQDLAKDFIVSDTGSVDKIIIEDMTANKAIVTKKNGIWHYQNEAYNSADKVWVKGDEYRARQDAADLILKTFKTVKLESFVPENARENISRQMAVQYKKVDIYQNGVLSKTWYVGMPTKDHYGTYMYIETPDCGRSKWPFIMGAQGFNGTLGVRFFTEEHEWRYTGLWTINPADISRVEVVPHLAPDSAFTLTLEGESDFGLIDSKGNNIKTVYDKNVANYLRNFKKLHFEKLAIQLSERQRDSVINEAPLYYTIKTEMKDGTKQSIRVKKRKMPPNSFDISGRLIEEDVDRLYGILDDNTIVVIQYHVFGHLFKDIRLFGTVL